MQELVERFRTAADRHFTSGRRRNSYPDEMKSLALEAYEAGQAQGVTPAQIAKQLGLTVHTLRTWAGGAAPARLAASGPQTPLRPVEIAPEPARAPEHPCVAADTGRRERRPAFVVRARGILEIECEEAEAVAALIRALA
ncbi:MAG TPA: hypothetical protein VFH51_01035 [Myxococcota bacterium]|nr:hypothetical protein [Myxococcota bacterium]